MSTFIQTVDLIRLTHHLSHPSYSDSMHFLPCRKWQLVRYLFERFGERDGVFQSSDPLLVAEVHQGEPLQLFDRRRVDLEASPHVELKLRTGANVSHYSIIDPHSPCTGAFSQHDWTVKTHCRNSPLNYALDITLLIATICSLLPAQINYSKWESLLRKLPQY